MRNLAVETPIGPPIEALSCSLSLLHPRHTLECQWGPRATFEFCPNARREQVRRRTGVARPEWCKTNVCVHCNVIKARDLHHAIALAKPRQMLLITGLSGRWAQDQEALRQIRQTLRRDGTHTRWVSAIEANPSGDGQHHLHGYTTGDLIDRDRLAELAERQHLGKTNIKPVTYAGDFAYPMKNATWNQASLDSHLEANNGRLIQAQTFWHDPATGEALTQREAIARANPRNRLPDDLILVPRSAA
jgi:hypothetical protein